MVLLHVDSPEVVSPSAGLAPRFSRVKVGVIARAAPAELLRQLLERHPLARVAAL
jgi:hypothetical protein